MQRGTQDIEHAAAPGPSENGETRQKMWGWPTFLSIGFTVLILVVLVALLDVREVWRHISACKKSYVLLGGLAHYATYLVRGARWKLSLSHVPVRSRWTRFALLVFFYNFVDNLVPAKLGDVYAAHLARINFRIRRSLAMGSIVFLRMIDAWAVLSLAALSSWILFSDRLPRPVAWSLILGAAVALGATLVILAVFFARNGLPRWVPAKLQQMIHAFREGMWPSGRQLVPIALLTTAIWTLETLWIVSLLLAFGLKISPVQGVFLTAIPLIASAFPLTPSGTGAVELTLFSCLSIVGVPTPMAASITVVNRLVDYWLHIGLGAVTWGIRQLLGIRTWREVGGGVLDPPGSLKIPAG